MSEGFRPTKGRGQNFLVDPGLARKFVTALAPGPGDRVLEIGPGKGALTVPALETGAEVIAIELEESLARGLEGERRERLRVFHADFLELDFATLPEPPPGGWLVLSNVPYSITGPLLVRLLAEGLPVARMVLGLQREVAERMAAPPGGKDYGSLTVMAACFGPVKTLFRIAPGAYRPRPKVESAAIEIRRDPAREPMRRRGDLERTVRAAFSARRKTIANSLANGLARPRAGIEAALSAAGIDPMRRAETLGVEEFRTLARALTLAAPPALGR